MERHTNTHCSLPFIKMYTDQREGQRGPFIDPFFYLFLGLLSNFFFIGKIQTNMIKLRYNRSMICQRNAN